MKWNVNMGHVKKGLKVVTRLGKTVVIEGLKGTALKGATVGVRAMFGHDGKSLKDLSLDDVLVKSDLADKLLDNKKEDVVEELIEAAVEEVVTEPVKVEVIKPV